METAAKEEVFRFDVLSDGRRHADDVGLKISSASALRRAALAAAFEFAIDTGEATRDVVVEVKDQHGTVVMRCSLRCE